MLVSTCFRDKNELLGTEGTSGSLGSGTALLRGLMFAAQGGRNLKCIKRPGILLVAGIGALGSLLPHILPHCI